MPWNGSGAITLPEDFEADLAAGPPASAITAAKMMSMFNDVASSLEDTLNRNGENAMAANIDAGSNKFTNLAAGSAVNDSVRVRQVAESSLIYCGTSGGTAAALTITNASISTVAVGTILEFNCGLTNAAGATLAVNGGAAVALKELDGTAIEASRFITNRPGRIMWNGTFYVALDGGGVKIVAGDIGVKVQAYDAQLADVAGLTPSKGVIIAGSGTNFAALAAGTDGYVPVAKAAATNGIAWSALFPATTAVLMYESSVSGWTISTLNNYAVRISTVAGGAGSTTAGTGFDTVFADRIISANNLPTHTHAVGTLVTTAAGVHTHAISGVLQYYNSVSGSGSIEVVQPTGASPTSGALPSFNTGGATYTGTGASGVDHTHPITGSTGNNTTTATAMDFDVQTVNVGVFTKNAY